MKINSYFLFLFPCACMFVSHIYIYIYKEGNYSMLHKRVLGVIQLALLIIC